MKRTAAAAMAATGLLALAGATALAQHGTSNGPRWQAWLGCWAATQPGGDGYGSAQFASPTVCIVPTSDADVVEVATISDGKLLSRDRLDASGREQAIDAKAGSTGCSGMQKAQWSADERRVYLRATTTCDGMRSTTSAILGLTPGGEWIDIRGVSAGGGANVRVARYRDLGIPSTVPTDIATALSGRRMSTQSARIAAGAPIGTNAVIEAARAADSAVVAAWLLERGQRFSLNAQSLIALSNAGVPAAVTDAMVAVSNPSAFQLARADVRRSTEADDDMYAGRRTTVYLDPFDSPWGYSRYGYNGYGYGSGYGYPYYGGGSYGGYYGRPIIVVTGRDAPSTSGGQAVKGRGYTQNQPSASTDRSGYQRPSSGSTQSSPSPSSSGSTQSAPSQPSQPAERTAHPRP